MPGDRENGDPLSPNGERNGEEAEDEDKSKEYLEEPAGPYSLSLADDPENWARSKRFLIIAGLVSIVLTVLLFKVLG